MKKLAVFTLYDEKGASSQYRAYIFKEILDKQFETNWYYFWDNTYVTKYMRNKKKYPLQIIFKYICSAVKRWYQLNFLASKVDVIFLQKASIPKVHNHFLKKAKKNGVKIIFDVDDAIYLTSGDNSDDIAKIADEIICGNQNLYEHYSKINPHTVVLPTIENTFRYEKYWRNTFDDKKIGWIGSKTTIPNLELIVSPINNIVERHPEVKFYIISDSPLNYTEKIKNCYFIKWDKEKYIECLSDFTVGIMPLEDNEFNRGKCGFKLIQYLNMKKPVIGSGVGVNESIIRGNGIVANTEEEWENALEFLLYNKDGYEKFVKNINRDFFKTYHIKNVSKALIKILEEN